MATAPAFQEPPLLAGLRFAVELLAWIAIYVAWGLIPVILAIAALTLFSVPGDKHLVLVPVAGPVRIALEATVTVLGVWGAGVVFGPWAGAALGIAALAVAVLTRRRWAWLWRRRRA